MIRPTGSHRWRTLLPLGRAYRNSLPKAAMLGAEVIYAAHQVHPQLQRLDPVGQATAPTHQAGQPAAERGVEPLDVRGVDLLPRPGPLQHPVDPPEAPPDDTPDDRHQTATAVVLDHLAQQDPPGPAVGRSSRSSRG